MTPLERHAERERILESREKPTKLESFFDRIIKQGKIRILTSRIEEQLAKYRSYPCPIPQSLIQERNQVALEIGKLSVEYKRITGEFYGSC